MASPRIHPDIWIVPRSDESLASRIEELTERLHSLDWRIHDVVISPVTSIEGAPRETVVGPEHADSRRGDRVTGEGGSGRLG